MVPSLHSGIELRSYMVVQHKMVGKRTAVELLAIIRPVAGFVFSVIVASATAAEKAAVELPRFGPLPVPHGWRVLDRGTLENRDQSSHWVVFQKGEKTEYLSFYAFGPPRSRITNAIYFTDTAHEIFPDGRIAGTIRPRLTYTRGPSIWSLRSGLVALDGYEALEYSFVAEFEAGGDNLLAHGYVLFGDFAMIVQHTSDRPNTPEFVWSVAAQTMRRLSKISAPKNLKTK